MNYFTRHSERRAEGSQLRNVFKRSLHALRLVGMTCCFLSVIAFPAYSQENQSKTVSEATRLELSQKMHEIWPVRPKVEDALDMAAQSFDPVNRPSFKSEMRRAIDFDELEKESVEAMARIYTAAELEAMIAFYGSPEGRAVSAKSGEYTEALKPVITRMLDKALLDVRTGQPAN